MSDWQWWLRLTRRSAVRSASPNSTGALLEFVPMNPTFMLPLTMDMYTLSWPFDSPQTESGRMKGCMVVEKWCRIARAALHAQYSCDAW